MTGIVAALTPLKTRFFYELLVIAGGGGATDNAGGGVGGAGGGAGGVRYFSGQSITSSPFTVTIGAGGTGGLDTACTKGNPSVFGSLSSSGGGNGRRPLSSNPDGIGGSGGGIVRIDPYLLPGPSPYFQSTGNSGGYSPVEGYPGSAVPAYPNVNNRQITTAGGGAGGAIADEVQTGGNGAQYSITGTPTYYGGGGGAGRTQQAGYPFVPGGAGGLGGGGSGGLTGADPGVAGSINTGGGGGGGASYGPFPSASGAAAGGGSGVVIVAYPNGTSVNLQVGPGLTYTTDTTSRPGKKVITFTAGTGTCNWA